MATAAPAKQKITSAPTQSVVAAYMAEANRRDGIWKNLSENEYADLMTQRQKGEKRLFDLDGLSGFVMKCFWDAYFFKNRWMQYRLANCARRYHGEYEDEVLQRLELGRGCREFVSYTGTKARDGFSWIAEILGDAMRRTPFPLKPSPSPQISPDLRKQIIEEIQRQAMEEYMATGEEPTPERMVQAAQTWKAQYDFEVYRVAANAARRHEAALGELWLEGSFEAALTDVLRDTFVYPAAILRYEVRQKRREIWKNGKVERRLVPTLCGRRVSPWDFYPSPQCGGVGDGFAFEWRRATRSALDLMRGTPGVNDVALTKALSIEPTSYAYYAPYQTTRLIYEGRDLLPTMGSSDDRYDVYDFWGGVKGQYLIEWGWDEKTQGKLEPERDYAVNCVMVGVVPVKCTLNRLESWPFFVTSYERVPDSIWGIAMPERLTPAQNLINLAVRQIGTNMAITGGPQIIADVSSIHPSSLPQIGWIADRKITLVESRQMGGGQPLQLLDVPSHVREHLAVLDTARDMADDLSGIPAYRKARDEGGGRETAGAARQRYALGSKGIRQVATNINSDILVPLGQTLVSLNNLYGDDDSIKGDLMVDVEGLAGAMSRDDAQAKRMALWQAASTNETVMRRIGDEAYMELTRELFRDAECEEILPSPIEVDAATEQAKNQQAAAPPPGEQSAQPMAAQAAA